MNFHNHPNVSAGYYLREDVIANMKAVFRTSKTVLLHSAPGNGKTILAAQFCSQTRSDTLWINASSENTVSEALNTFLEALGKESNRPIEEKLNIFDKILKSGKTWLIVLDNYNQDNSKLTKKMIGIIRQNNDCKLIVTAQAERTIDFGQQAFDISIANKSENGRKFLSGILKSITALGCDEYSDKMLDKSPTPLFAVALGMTIQRKKCSYKYLFENDLVSAAYAEEVLDYEKTMAAALELWFETFCVAENNEMNSIGKLLYVISFFTGSDFKRTDLMHNYSVFKFYNVREEAEEDFGAIVRAHFIEDFEDYYRILDLISANFLIFWKKKDRDAKLKRQLDDSVLDLATALFDFDFHTYESFRKNEAFEPFILRILSKFEDKTDLRYLELKNKLGYYYETFGRHEKAMEHLGEIIETVRSNEYLSNSTTLAFSCNFIIGRAFIQKDSFRAREYLQAAESALEAIRYKMNTFDTLGISANLGDKPAADPYSFFRSNLAYAYALLYYYESSYGEALNYMNESICRDMELRLHNFDNISKTERTLCRRQWKNLMSVFAQPPELDIAAVLVDADEVVSIANQMLGSESGTTKILSGKRQEIIERIKTLLRNCKLIE